MEDRKYKGKGRPQNSAVPELVGYHIEATIQENSSSIATELAIKGRFILGTNELDREIWSSAFILSDYKSLQNVENGFRFCAGLVRVRFVGRTRMNFKGTT